MAYDKDFFRLIGFLGASIIWCFKYKTNYKKFVVINSKNLFSVFLGLLVIFILIMLLNTIW